MAAGDLPGARKAYDERLTLSRAVLAQNPGGAHSHHDVALSPLQTGICSTSMDPLEAGSQDLEEAAKILRQLTQAAPENTIYRQHLKLVEDRLTELTGDAPSAKGKK